MNGFHSMALPDHSARGGVRLHALGMCWPAAKERQEAFDSKPFRYN